MELSRRSSSAPARWLQDRLEARGRHRPFWPDWSDFGDWPDRWSELMTESRMKVEEYQEGDELVIRAELPGIDPDTDVELTVSDGMLRLKAERRQQREVEDKAGYRSEFSYGAFSRTLPLAPGVGEEDVKASYRDGILEVRLPIDREEAAARKIQISRD
jgi:HSP20 family protein